MKVQLIQPGTGEYRSNSRSGSYPPLGLISIATYIYQECPSVEVEILDGELISDEEIISRLDADIVGLSTNTVNYPQAVMIAEKAKKNGSKIVLGGVYASAIPELILRKRGYLIDSLVVGYGEKPMVDIIKGRTEKLIINQQPEFNNLPYPDRSLVDLNEYIKVFNRCRPTWEYRGTSIFTNVGCNWREKNGGCIFCSRSGARTARKQPEAIWQEVRELVDNYQIDYLADFSDTSLQDIEWLRSLINAKPKDLNVNWHIFSRIDEINLESLKLVNELPSNHIFVGIESGDPNIYNSSHKGGGSPQESIMMAKLFKKFGISLSPSYVIGLQGETKESLMRTYEHAQQLQDITGFDEIICSQLIPFPGSPAFKMLRDRVCIDTDILDAENLKYLWAKHFCSISYDAMEKYTFKILSLGKYKITIAKNYRPDIMQGEEIQVLQDGYFNPEIRPSLESYYSCI